MTYIPEFDQEVFNDFVIKHGGAEVLNDPAHIQALSDFIISFVSNLGFRPDVFMGASDHAQGVAAATHDRWIALQGGLENNFESKKIVLIDTAVTNGDPFITSAEAHRDQGVIVIAAIGLLDHNVVCPGERSVGQVLAASGIPYYALTSLKTLLEKDLKV